LQLGDQNNSFFHRSLKIQNVKSTITHLWDEHGNRVEDVEQIKKMVAQFYEKLLGSNQMQFTKLKVARIRHLIPTVISSDKVANLEEITTEEIRDTLFHMLANKAPGPDGYYV
jgi:pimeloyl-CoA synthetase